MEPVESEEVCSKLRCSDIAAETLETLPRMDDMNTQMRGRGAGTKGPARDFFVSRFART